MCIDSKGLEVSFLICHLDAKVYSRNQTHPLGWQSESSHRFLAGSWLLDCSHLAAGLVSTVYPDQFLI